MRAGAYSLQHALTGEAEAVVKQAVVLAKRRGHAQVTPLHVANTMLAASGGLLRAACLQCHSHPLQCKALELCFNVALNRLPASSSSPMLSHHSQHHPSISNALVAAFKRAQAHQRRGSVENQQQPLLPVKIELEQLIISILDDPSISRVMREAGFSSTQVKSNVEKVVSLELCSQSSSPPPPLSNNSKENMEIKLGKEQSKINDDVSIIIESLLMNQKPKNLVLVGECISNIESRVKELMDRVDKGEVPEGLREVKFVSIPPLYSFCNLDRDLVVQKMLELSCLVKSLVAKGVVLYLGDLNWLTEYRVNIEQHRSYYCSVEHMIMELGRLVSGVNGEIGRFWLIGIATFQTYMRCRSGYNSLETVWGLHPVTIPANTLSLSLISRSDRTYSPTNGDAKLACCCDCSSEFKAEVRKLESSSISNSNEPTLSSLPPWLKDKSTRLCTNEQNCDSIRESCRKWNSNRSSAHKQSGISMERTLTFSSASPSSSTSCFSFDQQNPSLLQSHNHAFVCNGSSTSNSPSSSDVVDITTGYVQNFKEFNAQNLNILCDALEKQVPWQKEIIPKIAGTILQCRSRMLRRKDNCNSTDHLKEETWLLFLGVDARAKEKISKELAKVVFGSYSNLVSIGTSCPYFEDYRDKQISYSSYVERFAQAVAANPHRVFFVHDLEQADHGSQLGIKTAIERGRISNQSGEEFSFCDAIVVLSCERLSSCSPSSDQQKAENGTSRCSPLDLNISFGEDGVENQSTDELGILENVDRRVVFQVQDVLVE